MSVLLPANGAASQGMHAPHQRHAPPWRAAAASLGSLQGFEQFSRECDQSSFKAAIEEAQQYKSTGGGACRAGELGCVAVWAHVSSGGSKRACTAP